MGEYVVSVIEARYQVDLPTELVALIVALVAAGAFAAVYYKRDQLCPPS